MRWHILIVILLLLSFSNFSQAQEADFLANYPDCAFAAQAHEGLQIAAVVINLENSLGCVENDDMRFDVASVPKIFIATAYYDWLVQGVISPAGRIQFTRNYWMADRNACLTEDKIGENYNYQELIELMINCSDNAATWMLMDSLGWAQVNRYVQELGIEGIGEIVPYSEVDRIKLTYLDERWATISRDMASRFYRRGMTSGLSDYFDVIPEWPSGEDFSFINQRYFEDYNYNTITARALTSYILRLRDALNGEADEAWFTASNLFNVMRYTQRLASVQALPGTVYIGGKNGFDRGLLAEANILFSSLEEPVPTGIVLVFAQYETLSQNNANLSGTFGGQLNDLFLKFSPQIREILFPNYHEPELLSSFQISSMTFNQQEPIQICWNPYFASDFDSILLPSVENCFRLLVPRISYSIDKNIAFGMVLRNLNYHDTRFVFLYTAPDGRRFSYQTDRQNVNNSAIYWYHPLDMAGQWQIDIYINLQRVYTETVIAQR